MKVMIINSSLRGGGESRTELMAANLAEGMREAGADVMVVNLRDKKIGYCVGCFTCMTKTPGKCVLDDDMTRELFPKWLESDLVVYATPLFHHTVNAPMKTFIERTWPICLPFFEKHEDGRWHHPLRYKPPVAVILSVCGFFDESAFGALSNYAKFLWGDNLIAEIYRPGGMHITQRGFEEKCKDILEATRKAGRELIESRKILPETMKRITQPLDSPDTIVDIGNCFWESCIAEGVTPRTFSQKGMIPRPNSIESFISVMSEGFNSQAVGDIQAVLQFNFSGGEEGSCFFSFEKGIIKASLGTAGRADLTIDSPFELWMDIVTGKANGTQMFMEGKYRAEGDLELMRVFGKLTDSDKKIAKNEHTEKDQEGLTCREIISGMPSAFNAEVAGNLNAVIYYKVTGKEPGHYYLEITNGLCTFHEGTPQSPTLSIETSSEVWKSISLGKLNPQMAFILRKYKTSGDITLLMKMKKMFNTSSTNVHATTTRTENVRAV